MIGESEKRVVQSLGEVPFQTHVELLQLFLVRRDEIVERIQSVLNAQRQPAAYLENAAVLSRHFEDCFFTLPGVAHSYSRLKHQLDEVHWASGFKPRPMPGLYNDLVHPAEMMRRGFRQWQQTRWPGRNGRVRYAHTLFNVYVIRRLTLLTMRLWDDGSSGAGERLAQLQGVLDQLWQTTPSDQPTLVRDVRWLIPVALSPTTEELWAYFDVAQNIARSFAEDDRIEIHKANVVMGGGHLRSQLRHFSMKKGVPIDDHQLTLGTRNSNALDLALTIQSLVPLLDAYEHAVHSGDGENRRELADAIFQGISPDPELFVNRSDLLGPYTMIEYLFTTADRDGHVVYTSAGQRHVQMLQEYAARIARLAKPLYEDCLQFRPIDGEYSPYAVLYGFSSVLLEHMTLKALQPETDTRFSLEDVFAAGDTDKLAWLSGWRKLPHVKAEVAKLFEYPQQFAEEVFARIENALRGRVADGDANAAVQSGRLYILSENDLQADSNAQPIPELPAKYFRSSDPQVVAAHKAVFFDQPACSHSRLEGEFLVSYPTSGGYVGITKDVLTEIFGTGRDVKIVGLPHEAASVLRLMCLDLVALPEQRQTR